MNATLIAKLIEAGTPVDLVAQVAMELARAQASQEILEKRRAKDRERKVPRNSAESEETTEIQEKGSLEVSPHTPLPKPSQKTLHNPPQNLEERKAAIASCLRRAFPPPTGVSDEQWTAFCKQRRKKLNEHSYTLLVNKLTKIAASGHDPSKLIDTAIERGWETVFEPKDFGKDGKPAKAKITDPFIIAANKRDIAAIYDRQGRRDEAQQLRREAAQLEQARAA